MRASEKVALHKQDIYRILRRYPTVSNVRICGSVARGTDTDSSDVDFLVTAGPGTTLFTLGGLLEDLQDALGVSVDVISDNSSMDPSMKSDLLREAVAL